MLDTLDIYGFWHTNYETAVHRRQIGANICGLCNARVKFARREHSMRHRGRRYVRLWINKLNKIVGFCLFLGFVDEKTNLEYQLTYPLTFKAHTWPGFVYVLLILQAVNDHTQPNPVHSVTPSLVHSRFRCRSPDAVTSHTQPGSLTSSALLNCV